MTSSIATALSFFNVANGNCGIKADIIGIVLVVSTTTSTFLAQLNTAMQYQKRTERHLQTAKDYSILANEIQRTLYAVHHKDPEEEHVLERYHLQLEKIQECSPKLFV